MIIQEAPLALAEWADVDNAIGLYAHPVQRSTAGGAHFGSGPRRSARGPQRPFFLLLACCMQNAHKTGLIFARSSPDPLALFPCPQKFTFRDMTFSRGAHSGQLLRRSASGRSKAVFLLLACCTQEDPLAWLGSISRSPFTHRPR